MSRVKFDRDSLKVQFRGNLLNNDMLIDCCLIEQQPIKFARTSEFNTTISLKSLNLNSNEVEGLITILDKIFEKIA